ncbi:MAG: hypothetical protein HOC23_00855 [Halieaceae bacterium]|jgi:cell division septation protein DedD|nr:hypothetical protein [Halieaceae bacterium]
MNDNTEDENSPAVDDDGQALDFDPDDLGLPDSDYPEPDTGPDLSLPTGDEGGNYSSDDIEDSAVDYDVDPAALLEDKDLFEPESDSFEEEPDSSGVTEEKSSEPEQEWDTEEDNPALLFSLNPATWPRAHVAIAVVALILLIGGGFSIIQERASSQSEIQKLQAALAIVTRDADVAARRDAEKNLERATAILQATIDELEMENRLLRDTQTGLESQLTSQQTASEFASPQQSIPETISEPTDTASPEPVSTDAETNKAVTAVSGWFVNFGSYSQEATANQWSARVKPDLGSVVVVPAEKEGATYYRVRVVALRSKAEAETIARDLEKAHDLPTLWVGRQ